MAHWGGTPPGGKEFGSQAGDDVAWNDLKSYVADNTFIDPQLNANATLERTAPRVVREGGYHFGVSSGANQFNTALQSDTTWLPKVNPSTILWTRTAAGKTGMGAFAPD